MIELALHHELRTITLDVGFRSEARTLALFGDSGAGKTSVLNAIAGLLQPQRGRIVLEGRTLLDTERGIRVPVSARRIGYVFQDDRLFPHLSVRGNLRYGAGTSEDTAGFDIVVALLELAALLERRPAHLSGGERQRVAIGRALLSAPEVLLLDEPLTGLHRQARAQVLGHLRQIKQELRVATIFVSHQANEVAALADEVIVLHSGSVVDCVPVELFSARQAPATTL